MVLAVLPCFLVSCSKETGTALHSVERQNLRELEEELLNIVNDHRLSLGKNRLQFNAAAYQHANAHTDYMIGKGAINHDNFKARASAISKEANAEFVAENVAKDYPTALGVFEGWLNSTQHKRTMESDFTHTAISVKEDETGTAYYTQIFYR